MNKLIVFVLLIILNHTHFFAQSTRNSGNSILFDETSLLKITLKSDFTQLIRNKNNEEIYYNGECTIHWSDTFIDEKNIRIKARGYFRRLNCYFPPLMLNFKPDSLKTADGTYAKVKLVTHCQKSKIYIDYIFKEYLIYRIYELLSPYALKTRLVQVNYIDRGKRTRHAQSIGFLIEPIDVLCQRTNSIELKSKNFNLSEVNNLEADRVALFMYMIGNTDWRIKSGHNIKFIKPNNFKILKVTPVPYDFDLSGLINASYAHPSEWSVAESVTERDFLGKCRINEDNYYELISDFIDNKDLIYQTILDFEWLEQKKRKSLLKYIDSFFDELDKPDRFIKKLNSTCMEDY
nr:hypothetical protein [uncultured Carboxylicivirga sp.]